MRLTDWDLAHGGGPSSVGIGVEGRWRNRTEWAALRPRLCSPSNPTSWGLTRSACHRCTGWLRVATCRWNAGGARRIRGIPWPGHARQTREGFRVGRRQPPHI